MAKDFSEPFMTDMDHLGHKRLVVQHNSKESMKTGKLDEASFATLKMLLRAFYDLQTERSSPFLKLQAYLNQVYLNFDKDRLSLNTATAQSFLTR